MKTLGQIAREAFDAAPVDYTKTFDKQDAMWEAAARAVVKAAIYQNAADYGAIRADVLEECALCCLGMTAHFYSKEMREAAESCSTAIRELK